MMAGLGSFNAWSVFRLLLSELYGANVTEVNTAFFVASLVFGLVGCGSAVLVSRVGPRVVGVTGALVYGLGVFLGGFAGGSLSFLYLTYGLVAAIRSEEHTSELQSRQYLVCRLLLEKKKKQTLQ